MIKIKELLAREILDSRGNPTVECDLFLSDGSVGRASVPSGASTGKHEAVELRDGDKGIYLGKGVLKAVENIKTSINKELNGLYVSEQALIDQKMPLIGQKVILIDQKMTLGHANSIGRFA